MFCGKEYVKKASHQKYCSKKCRDSSRWTTTRDEQHKKRREAQERAIALYDSDYSTKEIAKMTGIHVNLVCEAWREAGLRPRRLTDLQKRVLELRKQGLCSSEIAELTNKDTNRINAIAEAVKIPFTEEEKERSIEIGHQKLRWTEEKTTAYVNSFLNDNFSYVSGYTGSDSMVVLNCHTCGENFTRSMIPIRKGQQTRCSVCEARKKEEKKRNKERLLAEKKAKTEERRMAWEREIALRTRTVICPECGTSFTTTKKNVVYCSTECSKRKNNRYMSQRKDKRIERDKRIDRGITAKRLYERDNGVCWICGGECDLDDFVVKNGVTICGNNYPSVDHVVPICEGGVDSWDNVKLAHRYCNSERYWKEHA